MANTPEVVTSLASLAGVLHRLRSQRVLLISGPSGRLLPTVTGALSALKVASFRGARRHVPAEVVASAAAQLSEHDIDTVITIGGGSTTGLGKALRLEHAVHFVAIPTTYAGSEQTTLYGITRDGNKQTGRDARVLPDAIVYDVSLTRDMSPQLTAKSLMNALAHPVSVLSTGWMEGQDRKRALDAAADALGALRRLAGAPRDEPGRLQALQAAGSCARTLALGELGVQHTLAHRLGGRFGLDHGGLHSVLLPRTIHFTRRDRPDLVAQLEAALVAPELDRELLALLRKAGAECSLAQLGLTEPQLSGFLKDHPDAPADLLRAAFGEELG